MLQECLHASGEDGVNGVALLSYAVHDPRTSAGAEEDLGEDERCFLVVVMVTGTPGTAQRRYLGIELSLGCPTSGDSLPLLLTCLAVWLISTARSDPEFPIPMTATLLSMNSRGSL